MAYGSFLEGLLVIYMDDLVADLVSSRYNASWERVSPMVMSVRDDHGRLVMSGESDFYFGRKLLCDDENIIKSFYFACSSVFSPIEHYVHQTLFPDRIGYGVTVDLGRLLADGECLSIVDEGRFIYICPNESDEIYYLCFDKLTGILMDASILGNDAYCYSNQQTEWAFTLGEELIDNCDLIWDYLNGLDVDICALNVSTQDMLKVCYGFNILSDLFTCALLSEVNILIESIGLEESFNAIVPLVGVLVSSLENIGSYVLDEYLSNPKFLSGVVGGLLFEAGMIATCTGVGAPVGLALMGAGTICTAYSSGLIDYNDNDGIYFNTTLENQANFGFSMSCNLISGGIGGLASSSAFKATGSEVIQIASKNAVIDSKGFYTTTISTKYVAYEGSSNTVSRYVINRMVNSQNPSKKIFILKGCRNILDSLMQDCIWEERNNLLIK